MRRICDRERMFNFTPKDEEIGQEHQIMGEILEKIQPAVLPLVARDLTGRADPRRGRNGMSAEQVLRVTLVMRTHGWSYEGLYERLDDSHRLREFCRYQWKPIPKPSTLQENVHKVSPDTWEAIHREIVKEAQRRGFERGDKTRVDCTVIETNIHYPTDASLLWDGVRVLTRILAEAKREFPEAAIQFQRHTRRAKRLSFKAALSRCAQERRRWLGELLGIAEVVLSDAYEAIQRLRRAPANRDQRQAAIIVADLLQERADGVDRLIHQVRLRLVDGQWLPSRERVVSLFEPHTATIESGGRETLFGHKVCLSMGQTSLVLDCLMPRHNPADVTLFPQALDRQIQLMGRAPGQHATDGGFASAANAAYARQHGVGTICFTKSRGVREVELLSPAVRRKLFRFRAGCEGIISRLKRYLDFGRCPWQGWELFQCYVWTTIIAHNLQTMARIVLDRRRARKAA